MDDYTINICKSNKEIRDLKIKNIEYAIFQTEEMIKESKMKESELIFLRRKLASSIQDLETLYLIEEEEAYKSDG